jgi:hypothetical protein
MYKDAKTIQELFRIAMLDSDFPSFILLIDYLSSVFPLLPGPRSYEADALLKQALPANFDTKKAFVGCYYLLHLGNQNTVSPLSYFNDSASCPGTMFYLTVDTIAKDYKSHAEQNVINCNKVFKKSFGAFGEAVGNFLWGLYHYQCSKDNDEAVNYFRKATEFDKTWYYVGEMYFTLAESPSNDTVTQRTLAQTYLLQYLNRAKFIAFPQVFNMLGVLYEKDNNLIEAAKYYCIGNFCGEEKAIANQTRFNTNRDTLSFTRQIMRACETLRPGPDSNEAVTYNEFIAKLESMLKTDDLFAEYFKGKSATAALSTNGLFAPSKCNNKDSAIMSRSHAEKDEAKKGCCVMM